MSDNNNAWLRERLKAAGRTQRELANHLGVRDETITKMIKGVRQVHADEVAGIAEFLGLDLVTVLRHLTNTKIVTNRRIRVSHELDTGGRLRPLGEDAPTVSAPAGFDTDGGRVVIVATDSHAPRYERGAVLFAERIDLDRLPRHYGYVVLVEDADGTVYLGRPRQARDHPGRVEMVSLDGAVHPGITPTRADRVLAVYEPQPSD